MRSNSVAEKLSWFIIVLPIDIENPYRLSNCLYRYISGSWQLIFSDLYRNLSGWAIIEELSIRGRVRRFLRSWGQRARVKLYNIDLSS